MTDPFVRPSWDGWRGPSADPNDVQFGDVVEPADPDAGSDYDVVLVGEPYDGAVLGRRGAREGPLAIRRSLAGVKVHHFDGGAFGNGRIAIGDLGDVCAAANAPESAEADPGPAVADPGPAVADVQAAVREVTAAVHAAAALPVFLGGDNSLTFANAAPLVGANRAGRTESPESDPSLGVVTLDAHLDCRALYDGPSSGTPYRQLFEAGLDGYVCLGARHFETSTAYAEYVTERGGTVVTAAEVARDPRAAVDRTREALADVDAVYVSLDLDVLDGAAAPGVSAPTPGGLATRDLFDLLYDLAAAERDRLAGFEVVECAPPLDRTTRTVDAAARAVAHVLAGYAAERPSTEPRRERR